MSQHRSVLMFCRTAAKHGGIHTYLEQLALALHTNGWRISLVANAMSTQDAVKHFCDSSGGHTYEFDLAGSDAEASLRQTISKAIAIEQPTVIHVNDQAPVTRRVMPMLLRNERASAKVLTVHGNVVTPLAEQTNWKRFLPWSWQRRYKAELTNYLSSFNRIICVSESLTEPLQRYFEVNSVVAIPLGVDTNHFVPETQRSSAGSVVIASVGSLVPVKGFDVLIEACGRLRQKFTVLIVGEGSEREQLEAKIRRLGLQDAIKLLGHKDDVREVLRQADIYVAASNSEMGCFAQLEAMACGLPSVCTSVGDLPVRVREGIDGYIVPRGNPQVLCDRLSLLIDDASLRESMGQNARARTVREYDISRSVARTIECLTLAASGLTL